MRERPITFCGDMIRALRTDQKTQTRRVVKLLDGNHADTAGRVRHDEERGWLQYGGAGIWIPFPRCPYGQPGDRLWIKEIWATHRCYDHLKPSELPMLAPVVYKADLAQACLERGRWRSAWFMPRRFSRFDLENTTVRVERLQEIRGSDVLAEGLDLAWGNRQTLGSDEEHARRILFGQLWDALNAKRGYPFESNPWVWILSFRRLL